MENMALQRLQRHDRETRMELIFHHLGRRRSAVAASSFIKLLGTMSELMLPYIFAHIIGVAVPAGKLRAERDGLTTVLRYDEMTANTREWTGKP